MTILRSIMFFILICVAIISAAAGAAAAPLTVAFAAAESGGAESSYITIDVVLSETAASNVTVDYEVTGGSAEKGVDYTLSNGTLLFAPGELRKSIVVVIVDDDIDEEDETIIITLNSPSGALPGEIMAHTYTINDNDTALASFRKMSSTGAESITPAEMEVVLSLASDRTVMVSYSVAGGTAKNGEDYNLVDGTLTFSPGTKSRRISAVIINDDVHEENETLIVSLVSAVNAGLGAGIVHTYTIVDNDKSRISFTESVSGDHEAISTRKIEVKLSVPSDIDITVQYSISGTAAKDVDYVLPGNSLTFKPGEVVKYIFLNVINDVLYEADETVIIALSNPVNAEVGSASLHTSWIIDDDSQDEDITLFKQQMLTSDGKNLFVIGPKTLTVNMQGIAIDREENLYISDQGPLSGEKDGSILFWPKGREKLIRIIAGLNKPGDIDVSASGRSLIVSEANGKVSNHYFGLSGKVRDSGGNLLPGASVTVETPAGTFPGEESKDKRYRTMVDGIFSIMGLCAPEMGSGPINVNVTIGYGGKSKIFPVILENEGQTFMEFVLEL